MLLDKGFLLIDKVNSLLWIKKDKTLCSRNTRNDCFKTRNLYGSPVPLCNVTKCDLGVFFSLQKREVFLCMESKTLIPFSLHIIDLMKSFLTFKRRHKEHSRASRFKFPYPGTLVSTCCLNMCSLT